MLRGEPRRGGKKVALARIVVDLRLVWKCEICRAVEPVASYRVCALSTRAIAPGFGVERARAFLSTRRVALSIVEKSRGILRDVECLMRER